MEKPTKALSVGVLLFGSLVAIANSNTAVAVAAEPRPFASEADDAATARWLEIRKELRSKSEQSAVATEAKGFSESAPQRLALEDFSAATRTAPDHQNLSATEQRRNVGSVVRYSQMESAPLAVISNDLEDRIQLVSLNEILALQDATGSRGPGAVLPPAPVPERTPFAPDAPFGGTNDIIFQPITKISPYNSYSPTAMIEGKNPFEYACPQPAGADPNHPQRCPEIIALPQQGTFERHKAPTTYNWVASNLKSKPLYFEDANLERYGLEYHPMVEPFVSVGRFGLQFIALPYQMALNPAWEDNYALGYYRPGDCTPAIHNAVPWNTKAAITAAGVYTGIVFLVP